MLVFQGVLLSLSLSIVYTLYIHTYHHPSSFDSESSSAALSRVAQVRALHAAEGLNWWWLWSWLPPVTTTKEPRGRGFLLFS